MAFGLKLRKVPKDEITRRVNEAAKILDISHLLDRKPKALSGGQRQRVAMGRAIVRSPKVFLMDEPLSNLDAKLRVQMRSEISKLHERLGTTIIYVTHDQTEAMTLGTRIVVMKDGIVQQINTPDFLYKMPINLFVAGFIGSPQMNFMDAVVELKDGDAYLHIGDNTLKVPDDRKSALIDGNYDGKTVVLGIRPENIKDDPDFLAAHADSQVKSKIDVKEMLGAEVFLYFDVNGHQTIARVEPETPYNNGDDALFALDMTKIHLFDKDTELNLLYKE
jgi:multiple sugar transport system ATP-binding protein